MGRMNILGGRKNILGGGKNLFGERVNLHPPGFGYPSLILYENILVAHKFFTGLTT